MVAEALNRLSDLETEIALLRDSIETLRISNRDLSLELSEFYQSVAQIIQHLETLSIPEEPQQEAVQVQAEPVDERLLNIGDTVRITSRVHFGLQGTVHSFTNQRVRVQVADRRRLIIRSANNLQRIN